MWLLITANWANFLCQLGLQISFTISKNALSPFLNAVIILFRFTALNSNHVSNAPIDFSFKVVLSHFGLGSSRIRLNSQTFNSLYFYSFQSFLLFFARNTVSLFNLTLYNIGALLKVTYSLLFFLSSFYLASLFCTLTYKIN